MTQPNEEKTMEERFDERFVKLHGDMEYESLVETDPQEIRAFIHSENQRLLEKLEQEITTNDCLHDSRSHCLENECYVHEKGGHNEGIKTALDIIRKYKKV